MTSIAAVIQARAGSSRLPGKVLAEVARRPMLSFQLDRLAALEVDVMAVATSTRPTDDPVAEIASVRGLPVIRGSEDDVLSRYGEALATIQADHIVRLTGDCPLSDPAVVSAVIDLHLRSGAAYTSNVHPRTFPKGLDVEILTSATLAQACAEATDPYDREHVTPFVHRQPERFSVMNLESGRSLGGLWWTVDTARDLERVRAMVDLVQDPVSASWLEYLEVFEANGLS